MTDIAMTHVKALVQMMRMTTLEVLALEDEDDVCALYLQLPRLSRNLTANLEERGIIESPKPQVGLSALMGGS